MVSIITCTIRDEFMENVFQNYMQQNWDEKELIIILNKNSMNLDKWIKAAKRHPNARVFKLHQEATLGDCLNFGIRKSKHEIIAKFDDDDYYGPNYLSSGLETLKNEKVDVVGKCSYYVYFKHKKALFLIPGIEDDYTDSNIAGATLLFKKKVFEKVQFEKVNRAEDHFFIDQVKRSSFNVYALNHYDFAVIRHNSDNHSWMIDDEELMGWGELVAYTENFQSIISKENK